MSRRRSGCMRKGSPVPRWYNVSGYESCVLCSHGKEACSSSNARSFVQKTNIQCSCLRVYILQLRVCKSVGQSKRSVSRIGEWLKSVRSSSLLLSHLHIRALHLFQYGRQQCRPAKYRRRCFTASIDEQRRPGCCQCYWSCESTAPKYIRSASLRRW